MHGTKRLRAELLRGQLFDRFFDHPFDAVDYFRSHKGFEASIFEQFSTPGGLGASIFDVRRLRSEDFQRFSTSGSVGARIFEVFRARGPEFLVPTPQTRRNSAGNPESSDFRDRLLPSQRSFPTSQGQRDLRGALRPAARDPPGRAGAGDRGSLASATLCSIRWEPFLASFVVL